MNIIKLSSNIEINTLTNEIVLTENGNNESVKVENQLMEILLLLLKNDGKLIEKEIFIKEIWEGNNFVGNKALTKNIFKLRDLLKSNGIENVIIETIPKKGYRLIVNEVGNVPIKKKKIKYPLLISIIILSFMSSIIIFILKKEPENLNKPQLQYINVNEIGKDSVIFLEGSEGLRVIKIDTLQEVPKIPSSENQD